MNCDPRIYGNGFNPNVMKDIKSINEKIEGEKNSEELLKLRLQRLYRGMELNTGYSRPYAGYFPY